LSLICIFASFAVVHGAEPVTTRVWQEAVISVTNLDTSARFFTDIGGYRVKWRGRMRASELAAFGLEPEASGEALLLGPAGAETGLVRLVRFDNAGPREPMRPGARAWDTGCYFSLMVRAKDLQSIYDDAIRLGWWTETPITYLEFGTSKLNVVIFRGPDGIQVQAYERLSPPLPEAVGEFTRLTRPFNIMQMVQSRDRAYGFFTDVLGFETFYAGEPYVASEPEYMPLGIPYNLTTSVGYQAGIVYPVPGEYGRMEMIEIMGLEGRDYSDRCHAPNLGLLAIRFEIDSLNLLDERLAARGYAADGERRDVHISPYGPSEVRNVRTPDGALIQFLMADPVP
jgi:catechol 2,3-dioxygenase-like lactoylglutathione lyase family enzyme